MNYIMYIKHIIHIYYSYTYTHMQMCAHVCAQFLP